MSSLVSCDSYSLDNILSYVSGGTILRLAMCGSHTLNTKIFASCTKLCLSWNGLGRARWPSLIQRFSQLVEFRYANAADIRFLPCVDVKMEHLPRSLKRLSLDYFDPVSSLLSGFVLPNGTLHYTSLDYATHFPYLETLEISSAVALAPSSFALFPGTLTRLEVKSQAELDCVAILPYLSRGLKHLSMSKITDCEDEERWKHFPPNLESLELQFRGQSPCWVQHLPPSLTSLKVVVIGSENQKYMQTWPILPRQLKRLSFFGVSEPFNLEMFVKLPTGIEDLVWSVDMKPPMSRRYRSTQEYEAALDAYDARVASIFSSLPASTKTLEFGDLQFCEKTLLACPWRCKNATIRNAHDLKAKTLPALSIGVFASLTQLDILGGVLSVNAALLLPTTIETMTLPVISNEVAIALGKRLVLLRILILKTGSLSALGVMGLPQSVTSLSIGHAVMESLECLKMLPKAMKSLAFSCQELFRSDSDPSIGAIEDPQASYLLPPTITRLSLYVPKRLLRDWFKGLAQHPSLEHVTVPHSIELSSDVLMYMPRTIRRFSMNIQKLDAETLKSLPRSVRSLSLSGYGKNRLIDEDLALLPENMYEIYVSMSNGVGELSENALNFLPKNIYEFGVNWSQPTWFKHNFDQFAQSRSKSEPNAH